MNQTGHEKTVNTRKILNVRMGSDAKLTEKQYLAFVKAEAGYVQPNIHSIKKLKNGMAYFYILNQVFPNIIPGMDDLHLLKKRFNTEECKENLKKLQQTFDDNKVLVMLDVDKMAIGDKEAHLEFLHWFKPFIERNSGKVEFEEMDEVHPILEPTTDFPLMGHHAILDPELEKAKENHEKVIKELDDAKEYYEELKESLSHKMCKCFCRKHKKKLQKAKMMS